MTTALATRPTPTVAGELIDDVSFALSAALASAMAALRAARERGIPPPLQITTTVAGVHAVAPLDDVLAWQQLLKPVKLAAADYQRGLVRIEGEFDGQHWTLTSMHPGGTR